MIVQDLMPVLYETARQHDLGVGRDCADNFELLLSQHDAAYTNGSPADRELIAANVRRLVDQMVVEAKLNGLTELRESTLFGSLNKLCPIYPFC